MTRIKRYGRMLLVGMMLTLVAAPLQSCKKQPGTKRYKGKMKPGKSPCPVKDC